MYISSYSTAGVQTVLHIKSNGLPFRASAAHPDRDIMKLQWSDHRALDPACCCVVRKKDRENDRKSSKAVKKLIDGRKAKRNPACREEGKDDLC